MADLRPDSGKVAIDDSALEGVGNHRYFIQYPDNCPMDVLWRLFEHWNTCAPIAKLTLEHGWPGHKPTQIGSSMGALWPGSDGKVDIRVPGYIDALVDYIRTLHAQPLLFPDGTVVAPAAWEGTHLEVCNNPNDPAWMASYDELVSKATAVTPGWERWLNCGVFVPPEGWSRMTENFPMQGVRGDMLGAFSQLSRGELGPEPLLFVGAHPTDPAMRSRQYDYGAACALMFDAVLIYEPIEPNDGTPWWHWRHPAYDLGSALAPAYQQHRAWRRDFERGNVIIEPEYPAYSGSPSYRGRAWII